MILPRLVSCFRSILILAASVGFVAAQPDETPRRVELCFTSWEVDQAGLFVTENGRDFRAIVAPAYEFGPTVSMRVGLPLRIYERVETATGAEHVIVGEGSVPPECRSAQVYLIRRPDREGRRDYRVIVLADDAAAFSAGQVRLFNFSPWPAAIRIGGDDLTLAPLDTRMVNAVPDRKHRVTLQASLQLPEGGWTQAVRDLVTLRENYRGSVTLLHTRRSFDETDPTGLRPQARMLIRTASEFVPPEPVPAARAR